MIFRNVLPMIFAVVLDRIFADPENLPHPVVYIGKAISSLEKKLNIPILSDEKKYQNGMFLAMTIIAILLIMGVLIELIPIRIIRFLLTTVVFFYCLAGKTLEKEALMVKEALEEFLDKGRKQVGRIVGRDTEKLSEKEVIRACVETVAENTVDGITAPMFWGILLGPAGSLIYKGINTMDSMIAYKNDRYLYFGRFAAHLDDWANFFPARLTALVTILVSPLAKLNIKNAFKVFLRDRLKHASPNAGHTEAAFSGAMGVRLAGPSTYEGKIEKKEYLNEEGREVIISDISTSVVLMNYTWVFFLIITMLITVIVFGNKVVLTWMNF